MIDLRKPLVFIGNSALQSPSHVRIFSQNNTSLSSVRPLLNIRRYLRYIPDNAGSLASGSKFHHQASAIVFQDHSLKNF